MSCGVAVDEAKGRGAGIVDCTCCEWGEEKSGAAAGAEQFGREFRTCLRVSTRKCIPATSTNLLLDQSWQHTRAQGKMHAKAYAP